MSESRGSLLIRGGRIIDPASGIDMVGELLISDGRIAALSQHLDVSSDFPTLDAARLVVCSGFVDIHCHLREPGFEHRETIATGTASAARGGFTTVCSMPNTEPPVDSAAVVDYILRTARVEGVVRVLPIGCVTRGRQGREMADIGELAEAGAVAFSDDGSPVADAALMRRALTYAGALSLPIINHCEEPSLAHGGVMHEGWVAARLGLKGVPAAAEEAMVARDIVLAELSGGHVHIAHVSTAGGVELIRRAKGRGLPVTAEVTAHHLTLTHEAVAFGAEAVHGSPGRVFDLAYDTNAKVNPPLRTAEDVAACVEGLRQGIIDCIATDHAPHATEDKLCEFDNAAFGISGLETALGMVLSLVHGGKLGISNAIHRLTVGPVKALGLDRRPELAGLGTLAVGAPGDVVVFDPDAEWVVRPEEFASKGKNTPLAGRTLRGRVVATIYTGQVVH